MENQTKTQTKKLYRSSNERMLAGVCGGIGKYFDIDPTLVRLFFVLLAFADGFGILLYIILAIIIPLEPAKEGEFKTEKKTEEIFQKIEEKVQPAVESLEKKAESISEEAEEKKGLFSEGRNIMGLALVFVGFIILVNQFFPIYFDWLQWDLFFPFALIVLGFCILLKNLRK